MKLQTLRPASPALPPQSPPTPRLGQTVVLEP